MSNEIYPIKPLASGVREEFLLAWSAPSIPNLMISHDKCHDGYGAVASMLTYCDDHELPVPELGWFQYNQYDIEDVVKLVKGKVVFIGDFSFKEEEYKLLMESAELILTVDHHKTPYLDAVGEYDNTYFDMNKAGALLTWEFLFPKTEAPMIIKLVSDRDIYEFKYGMNTKATYQLLVKENEPNDPSKVLDYIDNEVSLVEDFTKYVPEVEQYEKAMNRRAEQAEEYTIKGTKLFGLNYTSKASDLLNIVSKNNNTPSLSYFVKNNEIVFSLRNTVPGMDVEAIAKQFGGGGHKNAAGFTLKFKDMDLEEFFINRNIN